MPAELTAKVSLRPSYWPWSSSSASISVSRSAQRLVERPTSISRRSACQSSCLQPATVTDGARSTAWRSSARASGAGAASSCSSQIQSEHRPGPAAAVRRAAPAARCALPGARARCEGLEAGQDCPAHAGPGLVEDRDVGLAQCLFEQGRRVVAGTGVDTNDGVGRPGLGRQRRKGPREKITAVVGDHDGGDSCYLKN